MRSCPDCGEENSERSRFCQACGTALGDERIGDARKTVTVLFCDLVDSTQLGERLDPETLRLVLASLDDMKAEDTTTIDLRDKSSLADTMVVTSGRSNRHVGSVADRVVDNLNKAGCKNVRVEGMPHCDWVLIDAGDVIVHVFRPEVREFYNLEKMWSPGSLRGKRAS